MSQSKFFHQKNPTKIPIPDLKSIEEHFGNVSTGNPNISIAHMIAPPGWSEPFQTPEFDEYTLVIRGRKLLEVDRERITISSGESILIKKGTKVRYSNPFEEDAEYWAICLPAYTMESANREDT